MWPIDAGRMPGGNPETEEERERVCVCELPSYMEMEVDASLVSSSERGMGRDISPSSIHLFTQQKYAWHYH